MSCCTACEEGRPCTGAQQPGCSDGSCGIRRNPPPVLDGKDKATQSALMSAYNAGRSDVSQGTGGKQFIAAVLGGGLVYALVRFGVLK